jgi:RNA polymerase sigma-70 factor (ECF subfamily)
MENAVREHWQYVVGVARRFGHGRLDPEDLAQDVFERWAREAPRLPPTTNRLAWMTVVLRRLAIDQLRRRRVSSKAFHECSLVLAAEHDPAPWWLELETVDVARVLGELPGAERAAFELFELQGKSYEEIARALGIAKATVGVRLLRARRRLKRLLSARCPPVPRPSPDARRRTLT